MRGGWGLAAVAIVLSACASTANSTATYPAYTYSCCVELTAVTTWSPGQRVTLHWQSQPATTHDPVANRVVLGLALMGPFATVDQLKTVVSQGHAPSGVQTINAPAVIVTDRTGGSPASELDLPSSLAPGYYNLDIQTAAGSSTIGGGAVVQVLP